MTAILLRRCLFALLLAVLVALAFGTGARAQTYDDGMRAYDADDFARALEIWGPLAENGDAIAQYSLGKLLENGGAGVPRDVVAAAKWYQRSASQGVAAAQNNLGLMYAQGRGVPQDVARAAELWRAAAGKDHVIAQFNLGLAYFRGEGIAEDRREALRWFRRAAELGLADAQYALGQVIRMGLVGEADEAEALHWYQLAAAQGHVKAETQAQQLRAAGVRARMPLASTTQPSPAAPATETAPQAAAQAAPPPPAPPKPAPNPAIAPAAQAAPEPAPEPVPEPVAAGPEPAPAPVVAQQAAVAPPETEAAPAPSAPAPSDSMAGPFNAWLISLKDEVEARRYLEAVTTKHPEIFAQAPGKVASARLGEGGVVHRVLAGGLSSRDAAAELCRRLRAAEPGAFCKVLGN